EPRHPHRRARRGPHGRRGDGCAAAHCGSNRSPVTELSVRTYPDTYVDSALLMAATRRMAGASGVEWAAAVMGTPANLEDLRAGGFDPPSARANDLVLAVRAVTRAEADGALEWGRAELADAHAGSSEQAAGPSAGRPRTLED